MRIVTPYIPIMIAQAATGIGNKNAVVDVSDYDEIMLLVAPSADANLTLSVQGSLMDTKPNFAAAATQANPWDYIQVRDLEDASAVDGDTGIAYAGTGTVRQFLVNTTLLKFLALNVSAFAAGSVTAGIKGASAGGGQ